MQVTVAICTYNPNRELLLRALDAILAQLADVPGSEIVLVDNNSSPPLAECADLARYPIRLVHQPVPGLTAAREAAIGSAAGTVIVFVDDDNILDAGYLATVVETFSADPLLGVLGGRILPEYDAQPPQWFGEFEHWLAIRRHAPDLHVETTAPPFSDYFPVGAGLAVRRELALAYLEDCAETSRIEGRRGNALSSGEDLDLCLFALSRGGKVAVTGALCLTHVISSERVSGEYLQRLAVGNLKSSLALERKWSPRLGCSVYPRFSTPLPKLLAKTAAIGIMGIWSPRHRIRRRAYATLTRIRLGAAVQPALRKT
jgi:glycosyltransferase involved in cell wall biosynthesis